MHVHIAHAGAQQSDKKHIKTRVRFEFGNFYCGNTNI